LIGKSLNQDNFPLEKLETIMEYEKVLELVKKRRSVRRFKPDPIPEEYFDKIIEVARQAPSGFNTQPWEFVIVKDGALRSKVVDLFPPNNELRAQKDFRSAPAYIIQLGDPRTKVGLPDFIVANESMSEPIFISSLANSFLYMILAATSLGLTCQWVSVVSEPHIQACLKKLIGIPDVYRVYDMLALGYASAKPRTKFLRDRDTIVHRDYCSQNEFRTDEEAVAFARKTKAWAKAQHKL
jgi:5,6-dimethylbenzimidazole synthase